MKQKPLKSSKGGVQLKAVKYLLLRGWKIMYCFNSMCYLLRSQATPTIQRSHPLFPSHTHLQTLLVFEGTAKSSADHFVPQRELGVT